MAVAVAPARLAEAEMANGSSRNMEAYERWFASEARAASFFEHVVPIMLPDCVPLRIAFESEEISGKGV